MTQELNRPQATAARAVVFEQGSNHLVLVSIDNLGFYSGTADPLRKAILDACRLQPSELFLCAIHTHSAPTLTLSTEKGHPNNVEYSKWLQGKLIEVVRNALERLAPVQVGIGSGSSPLARTCDWRKKPSGCWQNCGRSAIAK